ncbi:hypothetical protein [Algoriphagus pacificus]|uniref:Uncharacterized protein n=1 Tax=Algoriphagus pacificus TaxID=2811234 RepID=A0ABS3CB76_9BACT|nr:hypothetical protein [Algoriphagus pacificus]MBN7814262.1 hypothetical protein [Algoriphagus pacificus]
MTKLVPIFIEGRKWIQLSQLSSKQAAQLKSWLPGNGLKKILFQGIELNECVEFATYEYWFRSHQVTHLNQAALDF